MIVTNRRQMAQLLDERMNRTYTDLSERQELESDTSLVKTYLLEAHLPETSEPEKAVSLVQAILQKPLARGVSGAKSFRTDDPTLIAVETRVFTERLYLYVDFTNPRYWLLHSMGSSNAVDTLVNGMIAQGPELDHAWLPADLLESVSRLGKFMGLSLDYDRRIIPDVDLLAPNAPVETLKMQLWGSKAADVLRILSHQDAFPHETTLSKVKVKYGFRSGGNEAIDEFSVDDIKYDGKATARGTSFQSHLNLISHVYHTLYAGQIRRLEEQYALRVVSSDGRARLLGEPINLFLDHPISDLKVFCDRVFSSAEPFRLWGVPVKVSASLYRVRAVDLHVGSPIDFEISPDFIRIFLSLGSCGNTILRLYTNLQHHYDSKVRAELGGGGPVFEF